MEAGGKLGPDSVEWSCPRGRGEGKMKVNIPSGGTLAMNMRMSVVGSGGGEDRFQ